MQRSPIPPGFEVYVDGLEVAGIAYNRSDAVAFASTPTGWLELKRELSNPHDPCAIQVIGCTDGLLRTRRRFLGYVPRVVAKRIVERGFLEAVRPRLLRTYVGPSGFVDIVFQILGPKGSKYVFDPPPTEPGLHYTAYVERVVQLKREKQYDQAVILLERLLDEVELESKERGYGVAPWYYEQLAIVHRACGMIEAELAVLERFERQPKAPGAGPEILAKRLAAVRKRMGRSNH